ncbi:MAG: HAD family hydrolase [Burkholderiaceae bacterium]|nr:HAD family hydrolase [Burkholderiaceae bacterium]
MRAAVFFDKDGTLVEDVPYNVDAGRIVLCAGAVSALKLLKAAGYVLVVVSNQPGVALGYFDEDAFASARKYLESLFESEGAALDGFYHCPHHPGGRIARYSIPCLCRKPLPGMLLRAAQELEIDLQRSWMVGDILNDVEAGHRAGCRAILVDNGNETEWDMSPLRSAEISCPDLISAARSILSRTAHERRQA